MRYWDSSAIIPLAVAEASTPAMQAIAEDDPVMCVWWATEIECVSALARLEREGALSDTATTVALDVHGGCVSCSSATRSSRLQSRDDGHGQQVFQYVPSGIN